MNALLAQRLAFVLAALASSLALAQSTNGTTTRIPDVQLPFFGPEEFVVDSWLRYERPFLQERVKFSVQLNANNVPNDDKLIPVGTRPNGSIAVYRIPAVRRYELTTKFDF